MQVLKYVYNYFKTNETKKEKFTKDDLEYIFYNYKDMVFSILENVEEEFDRLTCIKYYSIKPFGPYILFIVKNESNKLYIKIDLENTKIYSYEKKYEMCKIDITYEKILDIKILDFVNPDFEYITFSPTINRVLYEREGLYQIKNWNYKFEEYLYSNLDIVLFSFLTF
uniref:Uncharacterized protein n=1 Tax=Pithovirus LCDPAC02 TaxID=2506601 RepID=A0A481YRU6_9VIRU|nr:MAG: hypothetical protein LCDPAC02_03750 [Pithovirus LCDPAC02]